MIGRGQFVVGHRKGYFWTVTLSETAYALDRDFLVKGMTLCTTNGAVYWAFMPDGSTPLDITSMSGVQLNVPRIAHDTEPACIYYAPPDTSHMRVKRADGSGVHLTVCLANEGPASYY